ANDGGANVSYDGGRTWSRQDNQATAQFYHVITDDDFPYKVYGAQQDNSTVAIASRNRDAGLGATDFYEVGGCESGYIAPRIDDPNIVFAGCYGGYLSRYDHRTKQLRNVTVYPDNPMGHGAEGMKYRFQWTFPIVASPHDPSVVYAAGNVVFRTTNGGQSWQPVSPDLTRNDPSKLGPSGGPITKDNTSVEYYGTVFALAESPLQKGVLWAGSDDGLLHVSRDGGQTWSNVTPRDLPEWSMVSQIDPSAHDAGTAWVAVNRYKHDDHRPFVYVTRDYGRTWKNVGGGLPSFVRVVREDPVRRGLLFAGTETGVYVSLDEGGQWRPLQMDLPGRKKPEGKEAEGAPTLLPVVPITDLVVKGADVAVSTQGRSFWVLDDISPLRQPAAPVAGARLLPPAPAVRFAPGATFYYLLERAPKEGEEVTLE
ncbi:MAG TPA: glycosyl hydrolase, partial [Vicinamibacteria bacterium]|nr:glycosyl hydrolase [Vicinamibacteria bacterium]